MKIIKYFSFSLLIICLSLLNISCGQGQQKPAPKSEDTQKPVPTEVEEIEGDIIYIMSKVDLIPYYERQIAEREKKKQEKIELEMEGVKKPESSGGGSEESKSDGGSEEAKKSEEGNKSSDLDKLIEFKPAPITIKDIILTEVIKPEKEMKEEEKKQDEIPEDIKIVWHEINTKIMGLHEKWNSLEPQVSKAGTSQEKIIGFEKILNQLTTVSSEYNYLETLFKANELTSYIPDFVNNFKKEFPTSIYFLKYNVRKVVLTSSTNDYTASTKSLEQIKVYKDSLVSEMMEKKLTDPANKFNSSISDLSDAVKQKDMNIVKIKASVVMKNLSAIKEEISK